MNSTKKEEQIIKKEDNATFSIGLHLKSHRETKKITLDEVSQKTRISKKYLEAIESDDFDEIPAEIYRKGFIRNYAKFLGLNPDELLKKYDETQKLTENPNKDDKILNFKINESKERLSPIQWIIISILSLALIAGVFYLIFM